MRWNSWGQSALMSSSREELLRPKSSLTDRSAEAELLEDSLVLFPRNSHLEFRAKPCWGSLEVAAWSGAVPKTCFFILLIFHFILETRQNKNQKNFA